MQPFAISRDSPYTHVAWMQALDLDFPLLSDWNAEATHGFGVAIEHNGMRDRSIQQQQEQKQAFDSYVREAAGGSADEIAKAKGLLDSGAITQEEFNALKAKALA